MPDKTGPSNVTEADKSDMLAALLQRNIATISEIEMAAHARLTAADRFAVLVARFCGSFTFAWIHCLWFVGWIIWNGTGLVSRELRFDSPPFSILTLIVSLEVIFLSTFILISQNRDQRMMDARSHLDLQVTLLAEQENSQILTLLAQIANKLGIEGVGNEIAQLSQELDPKTLAKDIEEAIAIANTEVPPTTTVPEESGA